ncbi:MAG: hypothetical protein NTW19_19395 [Planctomycetota bacterium]|nr:hypothetical protein [Planctomycetota bacterium]
MPNDNPSATQSVAAAPVAQWIDKARARLKLPGGPGITAADLDELAATAGGPTGVRQRLLYLHAQGMHPHAGILAATEIDPTRPAKGTTLDPKPDMPYRSVYDAMVNGWRIVYFPDANRASEDRELGVYGYLFILEKLEQPCA